MNFLVFMIIELYSPVIQGTEISSYSGQFRYTPVYASLMLIGFISLIGIPPTGGFTSKMMLFSSAWYSYSQGGERILFWLVILGLINTLISLFYYLRIPYYMSFREPMIKNPDTPSIKSGYLGLGFILAVLILIIFIKPDWLVDMLNNLNFAYRGIIE
jgi:NADH-quinone oxidoreductase subunit N